MKFYFLVATALISLSLGAQTTTAPVTTMTSLTCVKTTDGYPTERMMLEKTDMGYKLMHQTINRMKLFTSVLSSLRMNPKYPSQKAILMAHWSLTVTMSKMVPVFTLIWTPSTSSHNGHAGQAQ